MATVRRLVLDVLKPHQPNTLEFARAIAALGEDYRVDIRVAEVDEQTETLLRLGIIHLVDALVVSEDVGKEKPAQEMFERALAELGGHKPAEALMVGDSLERDIAGAKTFGMRTVWLHEDTDFEEAESTISHADFTIRTFGDLNGVLRLLGLPVSELPKHDQ